MNDLQHIGIIMDGNRRWAQQHKLRAVVEGHREGTKRFIDLCSWCIEKNIPYVTVYAFSTENWNRSQEEVRGIFDLMEEFFKTEIDTCIEKGVKLRILGSRAKLKDDTTAIIEQAEKRTAACVKLNAQIAINYGGKDEIIRAVKKLYEGGKNNPRFPETLTEGEFEQCLDTVGIPEMDLVIRTGAGGRKRLSGFFPWQSVYAELVFQETLWPDFSKQDLVRAIEFYRTVQRNRGK